MARSNPNVSYRNLVKEIDALDQEIRTGLEQAEPASKRVLEIQLIVLKSFKDIVVGGCSVGQAEATIFGIPFLARDESMRSARKRPR
jgi:hypothetical protein